MSTEDLLEAGQIRSVASTEGWFVPLGCRGNGPIMEQWMISPAGRRWKITLIAAA